MDFTLIETMRWEPGIGFLRYEQHMKRLTRSADAFSFRQPAGALRKLTEHVQDRAEALRVRMTLAPKGEIEITSSPYVPVAEESVWRLRIAATRIDSADPLIRHKTSKRTVYETARAEYTTQQADEVILLNENGDVCEGTVTSIFVVDGGGPMMTPTLSSGLLSGVLRTDLICQQKARIQKLQLDDIRGKQLYVGNSLRGLIRAELLED